MNILDTIIAAKKIEVEERKAQRPLPILEKEVFFNRTPLSLAQFLKDPARTGIIAEFKRKSPSKGAINTQADVGAVTAAYANCGASAISVLTDESFFGGTADDLRVARQQMVPLLRKDFMIDAYQVYEAKAMGADIILLIAACLGPRQVLDLSRLAQDMGLSVLLELHDESELNHVNEYTPIVGINNRNLKTFEVNIEKSLEMAAKLPAACLKVAESGIDKVDMIRLLNKMDLTVF
ncbi:indole-3-glycerol phosphate synthase TrpC [Flavihumibacter sp. CACIAM 22H1]|uniref:indole-3-glycerol phosphate synthase TrpC n=1 Tax=Flavihumibacter sp. CACIAM 22H1 TaxID=1812911 RepID=UPI000B139EE6|nr:indole-3-glycerol phosphate synthase TrpC [Flavihumibacter sp. CACIAM 22H1]